MFASAGNRHQHLHYSLMFGGSLDRKLWFLKLQRKSMFANKINGNSIYKSLFLGDAAVTKCTNIYFWGDLENPIFLRGSFRTKKLRDCGLRKTISM